MRDGGVRLVWQPKLTQATAAIAARFFHRGRSDRQKFSKSGLDFVARQLDRDRVTDQRAARAENRDRHAVWHLTCHVGGVSKHSLLGVAAHASERRTLRDGQPEARTHLGYAALEHPGQGEIKIVAAEHQVLTNGDALERWRPSFETDPNQAEIGRPTSHVADQSNLVVLEADFLPLFR